MNSITVSFMKRVTTGPYEHEEMSVQFSVDNEIQLENTTQSYREFVYRTLGKPVSFIPPQTNPTTKLETSSQGEENGESNKESSKESGSKKSSKKSSSKGSKEEVTSTTSSEEMEEVESPYKQSASESSKEDTSKTEKKSTKTAKKDDGIPYDCEKEEHKSTLTNFLTKLTGGKEWAKDKERSRKISREVLHGSPFLAKDGSILPAFSELCKNQYGVSTDVL